jgi:hypothetical protein
MRIAWVCSGYGGSAEALGFRILKLENPRKDADAAS